MSATATPIPAPADFKALLLEVGGVLEGMEVAVAVDSVVEIV